MRATSGVSISLACAALIVFAANIVLLSQFPLYADETQWKIIGSRIFLEGFQLRYFFPACSAGYLQQVPITWIPSRVLDAALYADASRPLLLRLTGIITGLFVLVATGAIAARPSSDMPRWLWVPVVAAALSAFGVLLPLLVMNRPEQGILVPFVAAVLLYVGLNRRDARASNTRAMLLTVTFALLCWMVLAAHIKGFVLLPAMLLMAASVIRRPCLIVACAVLVGWGFIETYNLWSARTDCPELPHLQAVFENLSLTPKFLVGDVAGFTQRALRNLSDAGLYVQSAQFATSFQSSWFPAGGEIGSFQSFSNLMLIATFGGLLIVVVVGFASALGNRGPQDLGPVRSGAVAAAVLLGMMGLATYQTTKNFYETALIWPLLGIAAALASRSISLGKLGGWLPPWLVVGVTVLALSGHAVLLSQLQGYWLPWTEQSNEQARDLSDVDEVAAACNVKTDGLQSGLVVDDTAFQRFWATERPVLMTYFVGWWATGVDPDEAVSNWPVKAIVSSCEQMPEQYRAQSIANSNGRYCCVQF